MAECPKCCAAQGHLSFGHLSFVNISSFGFRHSSFSYERTRLGDLRRLSWTAVWHRLVVQTRAALQRGFFCRRTPHELDRGGRFSLRRQLQFAVLHRLAAGGGVSGLPFPVGDPAHSAGRVADRRLDLRAALSPDRPDECLRVPRTPFQPDRAAGRQPAFFAVPFRLDGRHPLRAGSDPADTVSPERCASDVDRRGNGPVCHAPHDDGRDQRRYLGRRPQGPGPGLLRSCFSLRGPWLASMGAGPQSFNSPSSTAG